jgi:hypothetical protein
MHARDFHSWISIAPILALAPDLTKRADRIAACCCCPLYVMTTAAKLALVPGYCRDRMCPTCARRRSRDHFHRVHAEVGKMDEPRFATFTLKHSNAPLWLQLVKLITCFRELRKSDLWKENVVGGIASVEVKLSEKDRCWHVHLHTIIDGKFMSQRALSRLWFITTGDSPVVDIRACRNKRDVALYIAKYCSKPDDVREWPAARQHEYARDMVGIRTLITFGKHHGTTTEPTDDGCYPAACEPLVSSRRLLRRLAAGCKRAAHACHLLGRLGGRHAAAIGVPAPEADSVPEPLSMGEHNELVGLLRELGRDETDLTPDQQLARQALMRIAFETTCPWVLTDRT